MCKYVVTQVIDVSTLRDALEKLLAVIGCVSFQRSLHKFRRPAESSHLCDLYAGTLEAEGGSNNINEKTTLAAAL